MMKKQPSVVRLLVLLIFLLALAIFLTNHNAEASRTPKGATEFQLHTCIYSKPLFALWSYIWLQLLIPCMCSHFNASGLVFLYIYLLLAGPVKDEVKIDDEFPSLLDHYLEITSGDVSDVRDFLSWSSSWSSSAAWSSELCDFTSINYFIIIIIIIIFIFRFPDDGDSRQMWWWWQGLHEEKDDVWGSSWLHLYAAPRAMNDIRKGMR